MADATYSGSLARTHLRLGAAIPLCEIATILEKLRRVPGVLLADIDASGHVVIAHDDAVSKESLVAALHPGSGRAARVERKAVAEMPWLLFVACLSNRCLRWFRT